jgi:aspartate/methionine/tyrosine aminotransferase
MTWDIIFKPKSKAKTNKIRTARTLIKTYHDGDNIINACVGALKSGDTHYTNSMGLFELREAVAETTFNNIFPIIIKS